MKKKIEKVETGVFKAPLKLTGHLKRKRDEMERLYMDAQKRVLRFAQDHGWDDLMDSPFMDSVEIHADKEDFDRRIKELCGVDMETVLPKTYSAGLEGRVLIAVSPEIYFENYPDGREDKAMEKLLAHEIAHRLHVRILDGDEDAMGPVWFFEGFAINVVDQFEGKDITIAHEEMWRMMEDPNRGSYKKYCAIFRHFLKLAPLHELVEKAGDADFHKWLRHLEKEHGVGDS